MGFTRFVMKHGIGAPGPMAKTQARVYRGLKRTGKYKSEAEVLRVMYLLRAKTARNLSSGSVRQAYEMAELPGWAESVVKTNSDLLMMTVYIVLCEHPELRNPNTPD